MVKQQRKHCSSPNTLAFTQAHCCKCGRAKHKRHSLENRKLKLSPGQRGGPVALHVLHHVEPKHDVFPRYLIALSDGPSVG